MDINLNKFQYILLISFFLFSHTIDASPSSTHKINIVFAAGMNEINSEERNGFAAIAHLLKEHRKHETPTFFLFGGGSIGPSILSTFDLGSHIIDLLNAIEPDVMAIAKRDFSYQEDELTLRAYEAAFPFVSSNMIDKNTQQPLNGVLPYFIAQQGPYKIGVLSTLSDLALREYNLDRIQLNNKASSITKYAKILKQQNVDLIILLADELENNLAELISNGYVDVVFTKEASSTFRIGRPIYKHPNVVFIRNTAKLALTELSWDNSETKNLSINSTIYKYKNLVHDEEMNNILNNYKNRLKGILSKVIGTTSTAFTTRSSIVRSQESEFGNMVTDAMKAYTGADIAIINSGGIRGQSDYLANQTISRKDIALELPYRNNVIMITLSGTQLRSAIEHGLSGIAQLIGVYLQVSGLEIVYDSNKPVGNRVISLKHKNNNIDPNTLYTIALSDYLAKGGDGFTMLKKHQPSNSKQHNNLLSDVITHYIEEHKTIAPKIENRLIDIATAKPIIK
jgi:2',3'-cyclic-nucleotide 2'-phosphodiesterase (5'-nucleotidase family)